MLGLVYLESAITIIVIIIGFIVNGSGGVKVNCNKPGKYVALLAVK